MQKSNSIPIKDLSRSKKLIFSIVLIFIPFLFLFFMEIALRIGNYGQDFSLFINHPDTAFQKYKIVNPDIGAKYFQHLEYTSPRNDLFLKKKDKNTFRIFVMGSSTVVGFPYEANLMFSRILQNRLQSAYPGKQIEMINTAITAVNSFTLLDFMDDILKEKPDAILIYAGHNEYYGAFGVGSNEGIGESRALVLLHLKLMDLKLYQIIRNTISKFSVIKKPAGKEYKPRTLMARIVKNAEIAWQSDEYKSGLEQYKANMRAILEKASENNVPVFYSTLVSNIVDIKPFGSVKPEIGESAIECYSKAQSAKNQGDYKLAKELYTKARDLDCVRFRASSDINSAIEELAKEQHAILVPMLKAFEDNSPNSLIGDNLVTEHVHPNISGYFLMADVFYFSITESKLIGNEINKFTVQSETSFRNFCGYTSLDSLLGYHRIENLKYHWPYRSESESYIDYRAIYKPLNMIDSLAFNVMARKDLGAFDAHRGLAKTYIAGKDTRNAYLEYKAIVQIAPAAPEILREAAAVFISAGDLPLALHYFSKSLEFEPSYFAGFRAGEICMIQNNYAKAAQYFSLAFKNSEKEYKLKILTKLYLAYVYQEKKDEVNQVNQIIQQFQPNLKIQVPPKSYTFDSYIPVTISSNVEKAGKLIEAGKTDEALELLLASVEINDSPAVNRMIGAVYSKKQDFKNASFYLEKVYPWFKFEPEFLILSIQVNLSCNKLSEAAAILAQLKIIDPQNPEILVFEKIMKGRM